MLTIDEKIRFSSGFLELEGILSYPQDAAPSGAVLLLSPHPHFAGSMDNNVLRALADELVRRGQVVLRFNYRGVEGSGIDLPQTRTSFEYWQEVEETQQYEPIVKDALAALGFLQQAATGLTRIVHLVGYSFGAIIAGLMACRDLPAATLTCIAPPLNRYSFEFLARNPTPKSFFFAANDFLYGEEEIAKLDKTLSQPRQLEVVATQDHFFRGDEHDLACRVAGFLEDRQS